MILKNRVGLVVGIANAQSIAAGCAAAFAREGAELVLTYMDDRALPHVQPVADTVGAAALLALDLSDPDQLDAVFAAISARWGRLDFLLHSVAFCPKDDLHGRVVDCSAAGFAQAMDISCHSFLRMVRRAEPLMKGGGSLLTVSYYGAEKVVDNYNIMGPVRTPMRRVSGQSVRSQTSEVSTAKAAVDAKALSADARVMRRVSVNDMVFLLVVGPFNRAIGRFSDLRH